MTIDSNTFGWILSTTIAVWACFRYWKRLIKIIVAICAAIFILFVVQIKQVYDTVTFADPNQKVQIELPDNIEIEGIPVDTTMIKVKNPNKTN